MRDGYNTSGGAIRVKIVVLGEAMAVFQSGAQSHNLGF